jgi:hypothetical protein
MLLHTLMLRRDTTYVSTILLLLSMHTRTTLAAYRMTYVASPHNCRCVPLNLCRKVIAVLNTVSSPELLETCITLRATDALRTVYVAAFSTTVHVVTHLMLLLYNLCRTVTQLMLLGHDRTIYVVHSITYDVMSLTAAYVRYFCCSTT